MASTQNVLVIGANRGIGLELATRFQEKGYTVFGSYRPQTREDTSILQLKTRGVNTIELDYTDENSINAAKGFGDRPLSILVNCAGDLAGVSCSFVSPSPTLTRTLNSPRDNEGMYYAWDDKPFTEQSADDLLDPFRVNVVGPFLASKAFLPALEKANDGKGKIINLSLDFASISDNTGGNASYRISKAGVNQLTKTMAMDLTKMRSNVLVLAVHPGYVATKMTHFYGEDDMQTCVSSLANSIIKFGTVHDGKYM
ncbi:NAD(P)-binding protein [Diplogelasinospora grovesii]|uniref:NAD(P)-binding protein n=1 Tax=Diplogelasinospora grovesii TaxID=303347 RepID=A0AAN6RZ73_9PEZI|nr:NAD(P)-binding protein [Diplogelasinospora grovesii]